MSDWDIEVGATLPRRELHARHGGAWYGGMEPAVASNSVFLFTNPSEGEAFGYKYDGWQPDGTFHYTGDGQLGPQNPAQGGNAALLAAASKGRTIRLFRSEQTMTTYLGAFELLNPPYFNAPAPDREGWLRDVLVFRLQAVGDVLRDQSDVAPPSPYAVSVLPLEAFDVENYVQQRAQEPREAVRREAALVRSYAEWLSANGGSSCRQQIRLPDGATLYTDLFDVSADELVEAKADADRGSVRVGLGQVLDYGRFVDHTTKALLLPHRPAEDLLDLLHDYGVYAIWAAGDGFERS